MKTINPKKPLTYNPILDSDSYKPSHYLQYPRDTEYMIGYLESRGGVYSTCTLFGYQGIFLHGYWAKPFTYHDIQEAEEFLANHGEPFNRGGFEYILKKYGGYWPVRMRAIPEGTVVPVRNAVATIECFDPKVFWCVGYIETMLDRLWYPSTVAILSREIKKTWKKWLDLSSDTPDLDIGFKHHDFGARGVATYEQSLVGSAAHLLNFMGSDTMSGIRWANHYYDTPMAGFSIPAAEHSTVSSWGRAAELDFYRNFVKINLVDRKGPDGLPRIAACVSDTYNIFKAIDFWTSDEMQNMIRGSGGTLVIRPDSGVPLQTLKKCFAQLEARLGSQITKNSKGYKVLPPYLRVIQGDGINSVSTEEILNGLVKEEGWSATNIAFGSGGGLLQNVDRDTQKWAYKVCAVQRNGEIVPVYKDPVTDRGKRSKSGILDLVRSDAGYETINIDMNQYSSDSAMVKVYENGKIYHHSTFDECILRMSL